MILVYHNIKLFYDGENTVNVFRFFLQMLQIGLSKKRVVNLKDYNNEKQQIVITFDDGYKNIKKFVLPILNFLNFPFEIFLVNDFIDNPSYLSKKDLKKIVKKNVHLQYHSKSHKNLWEIEDIKELEDEIKCPYSLKELDKNGFDFFAYPCWKYNKKTYDTVKKFYKGARSGNGYADNTSFAMDSVKVLNKTNLGVIINE